MGSSFFSWPSPSLCLFIIFISLSSLLFLNFRPLLISYISFSSFPYLAFLSNLFYTSIYLPLFKFLTDPTFILLSIPFLSLSPSVCPSPQVVFISAMTALTRILRICMFVVMEYHDTIHVNFCPLYCGVLAGLAHFSNICNATVNFFCFCYFGPKYRACFLQVRV